MSEQDHIALVRRSLDDWSNPDRRAEYFQLYAPDAVLHGYPGVEPGLDSIKRFYGDVLERRSRCGRDDRDSFRRCGQSRMPREHPRHA